MISRGSRPPSDPRLPSATVSSSLWSSGGGRGAGREAGGGVGRVSADVASLVSKAQSGTTGGSQARYQDRYNNGHMAGGESAVDILVCTPGRLIDHVNCTPGFTLQHLELLVVDEADRLLAQAYQDWLGVVLELSTRGPAGRVTPPPPTRASTHATHASIDTVTTLAGLAPGARRSCVVDATTCRELGGAGGRQDAAFRPPSQLRKLLFSATLTSNPQQLARLQLHNPLQISLGSLHGAAGDKGGSVAEDGTVSEYSAPTPLYTTPVELGEASVVCSSTSKPLVLLELLRGVALGCHQGRGGAAEGLVSVPAPGADDNSPKPLTLELPPGETLGNPCRIIVFTGSVEATHRLCRLLQLFERSGHLPGRRGRTSEAEDSSNFFEFSGRLSQAERTETLRRFRSAGVTAKVKETGKKGKTGGDEDLAGAMGGDDSDSDDDDDSDEADDCVEDGAFEVDGDGHRRWRPNDDAPAPSVLVCSDALARGLDVDNVHAVINYDVPVYARTYVRSVSALCAVCCVLCAVCCVLCAISYYVYVSRAYHSSRLLHTS